MRGVPEDATLLEGSNAGPLIILRFSAGSQPWMEISSDDS